MDVRCTLGEVQSDSDVSGTHVQLWPVVIHKWCVPTTLILGQDLEQARVYEVGALLSRQWRRT